MTVPGHDDRRDWVLAVLDYDEVRLTRFAARLLGDEDAARDVVQFAFLRLCERSPDELRDWEAPWLFTVCRNRAIDLLRLRGRDTSLEGIEPMVSAVGDTDPAEVAERDETHRRLNSLVEQLPEGQREAVYLWSEGLPYRQIAETTGRSEVNVRVLVHRALKKLREHPFVRELLAPPAEADRLPKRTSTSEVRS